MNSQQMMDEINRLARLCEAKDVEIAQYKHYVGANMMLSDFRTVDEIRSALSEAQAQIAMKDEALKPFANFACDCGECFNCKALKALSTTSETVAAWRAKETEPLRRDVAMLAEFVNSAIDFYDKNRSALPDIIEHLRFGLRSTNTQATALAYEREVKAKALEKFKVDYKLSGYIVEFIDEAIAELRAANKGEVK